LNSADLNYFNGGMFNCLKVIWLGLLWNFTVKYRNFDEILRKHNFSAKFRLRKISSKFHTSRVIFFDETFTRKFRQKVANFRAKIFRKLSREIFVGATLQIIRVRVLLTNFAPFTVLYRKLFFSYRNFHTVNR